MQTAIIVISDTQQSVSAVPAICREIPADIIQRSDVSSCWGKYDAFIFIGAMGICVRTIASLVKDKHSDPAVVCIDSSCQYVISVLSGHVGGANSLAKQIASVLGAYPIITTQSDCMGLWPLDTIGKRFDWTTFPSSINREISLFVSGKPTALYIAIRDRGTDWLESHLPSNVTIIKDIAEADNYSLLLCVSPVFLKDIKVPVIHYIPKVLNVGIGLAHQASLSTEMEIFENLQQQGIMPEAICSYATIIDKKDEPVIKHLQEQGKDIYFYTAEELKAVSVPTPSDMVMKHMHTPSVSEAAAILKSGNGPLVLKKIKGEKWTAAAALCSAVVREGHVEIVGAGPGDPDLVSVRGRKMLEKADLILYAGSLVPRELTECAKPGATVRSSAPMALEDQCELMKEFYDKGKFIVRLHTGDPCIFGAIQEQMAFFDKNNMKYHITPGISSFLAAAAELRSQFTIPERVQTIILTRGEGRTPMPEREKLHLLARSRSTMCIFLSASIVDDVQKQLLTEYPEDTPVAACYHLTWKDQHIYRGILKDLASIVKDNHLTLTTMIVVGEAIDNRQGLSELYSNQFTHLFRKAKE